MPSRRGHRCQIRRNEMLLPDPTQWNAAQQETPFASQQEAPLFDRWWNAAMAGDVNQLRDQMASGTAVNCVQQDTGNTALFLAVLHGRLEAANFLLDSGAEFKMDKIGRTPLYVAGSALEVDLLRIKPKGAESLQTQNEAGMRRMTNAQ